MFGGRLSVLTADICVTDVYGTVEDGTLMSSEVNGLKNAVALSDELLVAAESTSLVAVDWLTGAIRATDVTSTDDAAGVKSCGLTECESATGGVTGAMSRCDAMVFGVPGCCTDAGGVVISDSASAFRGVAA